MDTRTESAFLESQRHIIRSLEKITTRLEVLEDDYKERSIKKKLFRWLVTFYPVFMMSILFVIDSDHHKISEAATDMRQLIHDGESLTMYHPLENNFEA